MEKRSVFFHCYACTFKNMNSIAVTSVNVPIVCQSLVLFSRNFAIYISFCRLLDRKDSRKQRQAKRRRRACQFSRSATFPTTLKHGGCSLHLAQLWRNFDSSHINYHETSRLVPSRLRVTRVAGAGGDGKGKGRKSLSLAFLLPITSRASLERDSERRLGTSLMRGE